MLCEREAEIEKFTPTEYWTIAANFTAPDGTEFTAKLTHADGQKIPAMGVGDAESAQALAERISGAGAWVVATATQKPGSRAPPPPYTTSSMQQDAARRLGCGLPGCLPRSLAAPAGPAPRCP